MVSKRCEGRLVEILEVASHLHVLQAIAEKDFD
jgi:hypothetical protein